VVHKPLSIYYQQLGLPKPLKLSDAPYKPHNWNLNKGTKKDKETTILPGKQPGTFSVFCKNVHPNVIETR